MIKMLDTDFDALCDGALPGEAKRLRKLLAEWCNGDEQSFPVQLALLTRTQWRAAATVPRLMNEAHELMERKLAEHRQQTAVLIKGFADTADAKAKALEDIVARHTETTKKTVAEMRSQSSNAELSRRASCPRLWLAPAVNVVRPFSLLPPHLDCARFARGGPIGGTSGIYIAGRGPAYSLRFKRHILVPTGRIADGCDF